MRGLGVALAPFAYHCKAQQGQLKVSEKDRLHTNERSLPTTLQCHVSDAMTWQVDIDYRNVQSEFVPMNSTTWVYMTIKSKFSTADELVAAAEAANLSAFRSAFNRISDSRAASAFIEQFEKNDPEGLVPRASSVSSISTPKNVGRKFAQSLMDKLMNQQVLQ